MAGCAQQLDIPPGARTKHALGKRWRRPCKGRKRGAVVVEQLKYGEGGGMPVWRGKLIGRWLEQWSR